MEEFFKAVALVLLAVILVLVLKTGSEGIGRLLSLLVCAMILTLAVRFLEPVMDFIRSVQRLGDIDGQMLTIILKVVGISVTAEIAGLICDDAGNAAMGKTLQLLATAVIVYLSLPMLTGFLQLIEGILNRL